MQFQRFIALGAASFLLAPVILKVASLAIRSPASQSVDVRYAELPEPTSELLPDSPGAPAWLTAGGLLLRGGRLLAWSRFDHYRITDANGAARGVALRFSKVKTWRGVVVCLVGLAAGLPVAIGAWGVVTLFGQFGIRWDTLLLLDFTVLAALVIFNSWLSSLGSRVRLVGPGRLLLVHFAESKVIWPNIEQTLAERFPDSGAADFS